MSKQRCATFRNLVPCVLTLNFLCTSCRGCRSSFWTSFTEVESHRQTSGSDMLLMLCRTWGGGHKKFITCVSRMDLTHDWGCEGSDSLAQLCRPILCLEEEACPDTVLALPCAFRTPDMGLCWQRRTPPSQALRSRMPGASPHQFVGFWWPHPFPPSSEPRSRMPSAFPHPTNRMLSVFPHPFVGVLRSVLTQFVVHSFPISAPPQNDCFWISPIATRSQVFDNSPSTLRLLLTTCLGSIAAAILQLCFSRIPHAS
mmetsp:Transcript_22476/g.35164  ORF Transcript_22476/g.35164 Transcript_22476/m.35164 type:complete len:256 (-) Transcript_22476:831-1598(-)